MCRPALRDFHHTEDHHYRELLIATAIILRQFEEMDEEEDPAIDILSPQDLNSTPPNTRVTFLGIINEVIRSSVKERGFHQKGLLNVVYWISLRQEVFYGLTKGRNPRMLLIPEQWNHATTVNKTVMHATQAANWLFGDRSVGEWRTLQLFVQRYSLLMTAHRKTE